MPKVAAGRGHAKESIMSPSGPDAAMATETQQAAPPSASRTAGQVIRDIALFFAGPFVTLAYLALCPFIAVKLLEEARRHGKQGS
jgi:hypothetical protein